MRTKSPKRACKEVISFSFVPHLHFFFKAYNFMLEGGSDFQLRVYVSLINYKSQDNTEMCHIQRGKHLY